MKKFRILLAILLFVTLPGYCQTDSPQSLGKLEWLLGKWQRTNIKPGQTGFENWTKVSAFEFDGSGITLKEKDTVFFEKLKLISQKDGIFYVADVEENKKLVYFKCTQVTDREVVFENAAHDFPKKIAYALNGSQLTVVVSGNGKSFNFEFIK